MTTHIDPRVVRARSALIMDHPFFGSLAMRLQVIATTLCETMATDGRRLLYNTSFLDTVSARQLVFVIAHEVMHCALNHHTRRGNRDPQLWNIATDYVINWTLKKAGFDVPEWAFLDPQYEGLSAEDVYRILDQKRKAEQQKKEDSDEQDSDSDQQQETDADDEADDEADKSDEESDDESDGDGEDDDTDEDGEGQGQGDDSEETSQAKGDGDGDADQEDGGDGDSGGDKSTPGVGGSGRADEQPEGDEQPQQQQQGGGDPGRCGEVIDAADDEAGKAEAEQEWEIATRQAVNIAKKQNAGTVPGFLQEVVNDLDDPRTDWREVWRRFVDPSATKDYSWTRPNRRLMSQGYFNPGLISDGVNHVGIIIDSSGSIDSDSLKLFASEAQASLDEGGIDKVTVLFVDTNVRRHEEYVRGDQIDFTVDGRGGTLFAPAFEWLNENAPDITAAVYFTDLDCEYFGDEPSYPVLWAAYGDPRFIKQQAAKLPFGECIELTPEMPAP